MSRASLSPLKGCTGAPRREAIYLSVCLSWSVFSLFFIFVFTSIFPSGFFAIPEKHPVRNGWSLCYCVFGGRRAPHVPDRARNGQRRRGDAVPMRPGRSLILPYNIT